MLTEAWIVEAMRVFNIIGAAWLVMWSAAVGRERWRSSDYMGGLWLSLSWGMLLVASVVGNGYALTKNLGLTPALPILTIAITCGLFAQFTALRNAHRGLAGEGPQRREGEAHE